MENFTTQNQIIDVVMSLNVDQRTDVLNYVSSVQRDSDFRARRKSRAMIQIKEALANETLF